MTGRLLLGLVLLLVLLSVLLPSSEIAWMRSHWVWFNRPMLLIESIDSVVNLVHAILFLLLGIAVRIALPQWRAGRVSVALIILGMTTELMQLVVPGRHARVSDVFVDLCAGLFGWAVMRAMASEGR